MKMRLDSNQETIDPTGVLWFKVTGMLEQNWATVVDTKDVDGAEKSSARIYFFTDHGTVFDTLDYPDAAKADYALEFNGFTPLNDYPGFRAVAGMPSLPLTYPGKNISPVYSSGDYWNQPKNIERVTQRREITPAGLERFLEAQSAVIDDVMAELRSGMKLTHWMWFIFPQISSLGHSKMAKKYGIVDLDEAREYLAHPILSKRLDECFRLVLAHKDMSLEEIFGPIDAKKFHSCTTLFREASHNSSSVFEQALQRYFRGKSDTDTVECL